MNKIILLILLPFASMAQTGEKEFTLKGELNLINSVDWVYFRYYTGENMVMDSLKPENGVFTYSGNIAEPTLASVMVKYVLLPGEEKPKRETLQIFLEPTSMQLVAKDSLDINSVSGSGGHVDYLALKNLQEPYSAQLNAMYDEYARMKELKEEVAMEKIVGAINAIQNEMKENVYGVFVKTNPNSTLAMYALKQFAGWDINPEKVEPLFNNLPASTQQWPSAIALKEQMEIAKKTAIGKPAMDFTQNDPQGNPVSLSSFKGQFVLVDFWASWCGPCRRENPNLVKAYNQYKERNFTILGVSLDRSNAKDKWEKAIKDDGLTWTQISDLKFWDNEAAQLYGIRAIPQNILIDPDGKIIGKNLTGTDLTQTLEEILPK